MTVKINATGLVLNFVNRYLIWRDFQNFTKQHSEPVVTIDASGIPCLPYHDIQAINAQVSDVVAIDCMTEGIHSQHTFRQYAPNKKYIIFANGSWDQDCHDLGIDYELIPHLFFLFDTADVYNSPNRFGYLADKDYNFDSPKPYDFVSTIGNVRPDRTRLVKQLCEATQGQQRIVRYSGQDWAEPSDHLDCVTFEPGQFDPYTALYPQYFYTVSLSIPMSMYNACRFNLVVETDVTQQHSFFLTEKTVKVLLTGMPFVSMSTVHFLQSLHDLGFRTYHTLWDESYDQELDLDNRRNKVVQLCQQLSSFDWAQHRNQLEAIKLHNQCNFLKLGTVIDQEFKHFEQVIQGLT